MSEEKAMTWEQRYFMGRCSLFDALAHYMLVGVPVPGGLVEEFLSAQMRYQSPDGLGKGRINDFAEPLGIQLSQRKKKYFNRIEELHEVRRTVEWVREVSGKKLANPSAFDDTAFHEAAKLLNKSPSHVHDLYYAAP